MGVIPVVSDRSGVVPVTFMLQTYGSVDASDVSTDLA